MTLRQVLGPCAESRGFKFRNLSVLYDYPALSLTLPSEFPGLCFGGVDHMKVKFFGVGVSAALKPIT